jgi:predicted TIM-barrel fold metal-dependent hydrolase
LRLRLAGDGMHRRGVLVAVAIAVNAMTAAGQKTPVPPPPIIDVHLHALPADWFGPPPQRVCTGDVTFPGFDPRDSATLSRFHACSHPLWSPASDDSIMRQTLAVMERYNVIGVASGPMNVVRRWRAAAPNRIIPAAASAGELPLDSIRVWAANGTIQVLGELMFQYAGLGPADSIPEAYYALAEKLDLPVGVHVGPGPPGAPYVGSPRYRASLSNPLLLEETLIRHPKLRLYVMHAGWPFIDPMIALLYAHPQVYVDVGVISWVLPRKEFHRYLRRLVEAGFEKRVMFGSDEMLWPDGLRIAIEAVQTADFLTPSQKRDIFYNNAVRFLRLRPGRLDAAR